MEAQAMIRTTLALALLSAFLALPVRAEIACVWIPDLLPAYDPPVDALRIYLAGQPVQEIRPIWGARGGRSNFWRCGDGNAVLTIATVRGSEESPRSNGKRLGYYYGPREQLMRYAIYVLTGTGGPIDTNADGRISPADIDLLKLAAQGKLYDPATTLCTSDCL